MKLVGFLYEKIYDIDNIKLAMRMAAKGKKKRNSVKRILANEDKNIEILHQILKDKSYRP